MKTITYEYIVIPKINKDAEAPPSLEDGAKSIIDTPAVYLAQPFNIKPDE